MTRSVVTALASGLLVVGCTGEGGDAESTSGVDTSTGADDGGATSANSAGSSGGGDSSGGGPEATGTDSSGGTGSNATFGPGDDGPRPELCPPGVRPSLEVGLGHGEFFPLDSADAVLIAGPQGGFHISLGLHASGLDVADWGTVHLHAELDGQVVADHDAIAVFNCLDTMDPPIAEALWVNIVFDALPADLLGQQLAIDVDVEDYTGVTVGQSIMVTVDETLG
jgi:hypothetical protein